MVVLEIGDFWRPPLLAIATIIPLALTHGAFASLKALKFGRYGIYLMLPTVVYFLALLLGWFLIAIGLWSATSKIEHET